MTRDGSLRYTTISSEQMLGLSIARYCVCVCVCANVVSVPVRNTGSISRQITTGRAGTFKNLSGGQNQGGPRFAAMPVARKIQLESDAARSTQPSDSPNSGSGSCGPPIASHSATDFYISLTALVPSGCSSAAAAVTHGIGTHDGVCE